MPSSFADRRKLTASVHAQYLAPFPDADSPERVLFPLAQSLLSSSEYYESLWRRRDLLRGRTSLIIWGMKDPAVPPAQLDRWRLVLPESCVVQLPVGHWPQEEAPDEVVAALNDFVAAAPLSDRGG